MKMRRRQVVFVVIGVLALDVGALCVWRAAGGSLQKAKGERRKAEAPVGSRQSAGGSPSRHLPPATRHPPHLLNYELIARRNLFRPLVANQRIGEADARVGANRPLSLAPLPPLSPSVLPVTAQSEIRNPKSEMRMAGMVDNGQTPMALLEEVGSGHHYSVKAGDKVADVEVVRVEEAKVVVKQAGVVRELTLAPGEGTRDGGRGTGAAPTTEFERRVMPKG